MKKMQTLERNFAVGAILGLGAIALLAYPMATIAKPATNFVTGNVNFFDGQTEANASARFAVSSSYVDGRTNPDNMRHDTFEYRNSNGLWFTLDVVTALMTDERAWFAGSIVATNDSTLMNAQYLVGTYNSGLPDGVGDTIFVQRNGSALYPGSYSTAVFAVRGSYNTWYQGKTPAEITKGDVQIH